MKAQQELRHGGGGSVAVEKGTQDGPLVASTCAILVRYNRWPCANPLLDTPLIVNPTSPYQYQKPRLPTLGRFSVMDWESVVTEALGVSELTFCVCCWARVLWMVVNFRCSRSTCD